MSHHSSFGVDLNSSTYELHPSTKDSVDTLQGNSISTIRFSDTLSTQILDFVHNHQCHHGMKIGTIQFISDKRGQISFNTINPSLSNCTVTVTKEANVNTEVYETEYDRPPSNAMFLRRKGFVDSKLIIKPGLSNDRSIKIRNPITQKRATTTFKEVKGSQRLNMKQRNKKRRIDQAHAPAHKRFKPSITLSTAVSEILTISDATLHTVRKVLLSRTSLNATIDELQTTLSQIALYCEPKYRLKENIARSVNWKSSSILTESEKQVIIKRMEQARNNLNGDKNNANNNNNNKYENEYGPIQDEHTYSIYDQTYKKKLKQRTTLLKSVDDNQTYFKKMRSLIKTEADPEKQNKMKEEFRKIFNDRKKNITNMRDLAAKLRIELNVIKNRINAHIEEQRRVQAL